MSIFTKSNNQMSAPNRNSFDGRFTNNLTLKMGQITPVFCKEVLPGDSFKIDPSFGFNFQPFVFPVQTKIRANLHFFYVRNRALWRGWESFITKTENEWNDNTPPYIHLTDENRSQFDTGKIGDYLGIPTVYYSNQYESVQVTYQISPSAGVIYATSLFNTANKYTSFKLNPSNNSEGFEGTRKYIESFIKKVNSKDDNNGLYPTPWPYVIGGPYSQELSIYMKSSIPSNAVYSTIKSSDLHYLFTSTNYLGYNNTQRQQYPIEGFDDTKIGYVFHIDEFGNLVSAVSCVVNTGNLSGLNFFNSEAVTTAEGFNIDFNLSSAQGKVTSYIFTDYSISASINTSNFSAYAPNIMVDGTYGIESKYLTLQQLPFASTDNPDGVRISAMPFRAVDACYNAFYRDIRNNPFIKDGKPLYNKWVYSNEGGADTRQFELYRANWEQDAYTTAVSSPQQGDNPPLVGVTSTGRMTFQDENGNTYTAQATFGEDGETITGISTHSEDMPVGTLRALVDTISSGISINDFRNVNAYQVWLEKNMRKGLRYKDQIEAHFGTSPTYSELQMPEFIGGMSRVVDMRAVTQTSGDNTGAPLGTLAGQASLMADGGQPISKYCDEHGFIIGFISFVPTPIYSQLLPKMLTKTERFDYYFPEFANIGFQPIYNKELSILQCKDVEGQRPDDVFGYQRAWHEYLANVDEAHGDFRTSMKNYIIHRTYNGVPQLSKEFLTVSPDEANEVFAVQDNTDKIFGQLFFDVKMKRAIPKYGIPSLKVE